MNTVQRKTALIAELETIQKRWAAIQQELAEIKQAEHNANHSDLYAFSLNLEQKRLAIAADLQQQAAAAQAEKEAAWRASQPDIMAAKRQAQRETEMMRGRPMP